MKLIEFIKSNKNWKELLKTDPYNLMIKEEGNFILLKYNQIKSDFSNPIVKESRGIILDTDFNIVCNPFQKFFNYAEGNAAKINWHYAKVQEKIDGSIIKLWYSKGAWIVSTNGAINAHTAPASINSKNTFGALFNIAIINQDLDLGALNTEYTYIFELVSPYNQVVVRHEEIEIYHLGTKHNKTGKEKNVDIGIQKPKEYTCETLQELIKMAEALPYNEEGYVVVDDEWNRIKVKSPAYVAVHHLKTSYSEKNLLTLIRNGEDDEFLSYFPEYKEDHNKLKQLYQKLISVLNTEHNQMSTMQFENKKDFAERFAKTTTIPGLFFNLFDGRISSIIEGIDSMRTEKVLDKLNGV